VHQLPGCKHLPACNYAMVTITIRQQKTHNPAMNLCVTLSAHFRGYQQLQTKSFLFSLVTVSGFCFCTQPVTKGMNAEPVLEQENIITRVPADWVLRSEQLTEFQDTLSLLSGNITHLSGNNCQWFIMASRVDLPDFKCWVH